MTENTQIKTYFGFSLDKSASMRGLEKNAMADYNRNVQVIRDNAIQHNQDVIVSLVSCGVGHRAIVSRDIVNSSITALTPLSSYTADGGGTPLYDSVKELIDIFQAVPDYNDPNVSFVCMVITDGEENSSHISGASLGKLIRDLQNTDRWTFVFRVPRGYTSKLVRALNLREGNVQEWDQTSRGYETSTVQTASAVNDFFTARALGVRSTGTFYASMKDIKVEDIQAVLKDISSEVQIWEVQTENEGHEIRPFVEHKSGQPYVKGSAFYELVKVEPKIQENKLIIIQDVKTGAVYFGPAARQMIGLPQYGYARVRPGDHDGYRIFVQSTSVNRKLLVGNKVLYWKNFNH